MSLLGPSSSADGRRGGSDTDAIEHCVIHDGPADPVAQEFLVSETRHMLAVLMKLKQDYAVCLNAETKCDEHLVIFEDNLESLKVAVDTGNWSDAMILNACVKKDVNTLMDYISKAEAAIHEVAEPALKKIQNEKCWLGVKLAILESPVLEKISLFMTRAGIWGTASAVIGCIAHGIVALTLAAFPGTVTIPAGTTLVTATQPLTYPAFGDVLVPIGAASVAPLFGLLNLLIRLDEDSVEAVRAWFRRHRSSAHAALDRAEDHFKHFIERAQQLAEQKENLDNVLKVLDNIHVHCENATVISEQGTGSELLLARLLKHKVRVQELFHVMDQHLQALRDRQSLSRNLFQDIAEVGDSHEREQAIGDSEDQHRIPPPRPSNSSSTSSSSTGSSSSTAAVPQLPSPEPAGIRMPPARRNHRQRMRAKKWRNSVQIPTPESSD